VNAKLILTSILLGSALNTAAFQSLESNYRTTGNGVVAAFEPQRQVLQTSSAVVLDGRREIQYGVIVSPEGHILTKASELKEVKKLGVTVDGTQYKEVEIVGTDEDWDVALLKVSAAGLIPVVYAPTSAVEQGTWVVANGATTRTKRRLLAGIISAKPREIPIAGGAAIGLQLETKGKQLEIKEVVEKSGAEEAGLKKGDLVISVDGKAISKIEEMAEALKGKKPGVIVKVIVSRAKKEMAFDVKLMARSKMVEEEVTRNDQMSGDYSARRSGFPRVLQHDVMLGSRRNIGGPLLDLDGRCLGMNIARVNRCENFTIPCEELKEISARMIKEAAK
jgi:S1-C subfamily serine protease